jgi:hypothetical protein
MIIDDNGKEILNLEYLTWNKKDQYLLCVITTSLSEKVLATVYGPNTSHQAWIALATKLPQNPNLEFQTSKSNSKVYYKNPSPAQITCNMQNSLQINLVLQVTPSLMKS